MTIGKEPYFMNNEDWYYHDEKEWKYKLTDKAPEEAIKSYYEFYRKVELDEDGCEIWD